MIGAVVRAQQWFEESCAGAGHTLDLLIRTTGTLRLAGRKRKEIVTQTFHAAFGSMAVVLLTALFTGMILALQTGYELQRFGQESSIGYVVSASLVREMGPVFTAISLAGLIGSTYAASIGTMKVSEEIDALEVMSIDPVYFLVMPRVIALSLACTALSIYGDVIGIAGGAIVSQAVLKVDLHLYFQNAQDILKVKDIFIGLVKAFVFGLTIALVGCSQGLRTRNGAEGVGHSTMRSVVVSFISILVFDYMLNWIFY